MGGRPRFLGDAFPSYTCTGSALDVMDYGLARANEFSNELTARMLLCYNDFSPQIRESCIKIYTSIQKFAAHPRALTIPVQMSQKIQQDH